MPEFDFDIAVIGGGAGGGTLAARCAALGRSVLLVERGPANISELGNDEKSVLLEKNVYDDRSIEIDGSSRRLYMGGVLGGGTAVYGGAMLRPAPGDFEPGQYYGNRIDRRIWEWPIRYEELAPYYNEAERLFSVSCDDTSYLNPLGLLSDACQRPVLPMARINQQMIAAGQAMGLRPFRLPLSIEADKCLMCDQCAGFPCPTGARKSAARLVTNSVRKGESLTVWPQTEAEELVRGTGSSIEGVRLRQRLTGATRLVRARRYVLAAGAIGSPTLLQRSGYRHPQLGRNYMMHFSPVAVGVFVRDTEADRNFVKQVGLSDFYFGTPALPEKMGIIQSLPAPGPLMLAKFGLKHLPKRLLQLLRSRLLPLVGIIEDLPQPSNYVEWRGERLANGTSSIHLHHQFSEYDRHRGAELTQQMVRILRATGAARCVTQVLPSQEHVAHQCGTLRFGSSCDHAVVDRDCRMFDHPDVFVADGSFLPTSLGVGPSLTIIANALRVADVVMNEVSGNVQQRG